MSVEKMRKRINNVNSAEQGNREYFRRVRIRDYLPGQAIYNLGDYPARVYSAVTDYDRELIRSMAEAGVDLIQLHEEWNDACRLYGADKFSSSDPEGTREFIDLCHSYGIKVIAYVSSGYFHEPDPDFKEEYATSSTDILASNYYKYRKCNHGHPEWRSYITEKTFLAMDTYGFDGIFNDWGYSNFDWSLGDCVLPEGAYDAELEDALGEIYSGVKKRGGIYKLHCDRNNTPPCKDRVYDYLWIGEGVKNSKIGIGKDYRPYVVPCLDLYYSEGRSPEMFYACTIPFLQFPLLKTGRIMQGNNLDLPNVTYYGGVEEEFFRKVHEHNLAHPNGPYVRSLWSPIPDDPEEFPMWEKFSRLYHPMVTENSLAYIELRSCDEILSPLSNGIYASMFVNEETYLVVSNLSGKPYTLDLKTSWRDRVSGSSSTSFNIEDGRILFLIKE